MQSSTHLLYVLTCIRNFTKPPTLIIPNPRTGKLMRVSAEHLVANTTRADDERDEGWFARELYLLHGLEPVINRLQVQDEEIQTLALEVLVNFCKVSKNREELGELSGISFIGEIVDSGGSMDVKAQALAALYFATRSCGFNIEHLRRAGGVRTLTSFILGASVNVTGSRTTSSPSKKRLPSGEPVPLEALALAVQVLRTLCDEVATREVRSMGALPALAAFLNSDNAELQNAAQSVLARMCQLDQECRAEMVRISYEARPSLGNVGVVPR
eukprot:TRINITY_DN3976_c0_g1_i1.p1 TRINITY_DN3976_c0_g1~~TRINITY_DN3976_c0_g1_i1.p1  ORF type:complete len:271 (-),score=83.10 TRINITY_DN3976_c0_g1_i1:170-982(-)